MATSAPKRWNYLDDNTAVCSVAYEHIRKLGNIRHLLNQSVTEKLVHAFSGRLDYCKSILYGLPKCLVKCLQWIQNTAARLMTHTKCDKHVTPVLRELHWLPVQESVMYEVLLLTYKTVQNTELSYLMDLVSPYTVPEGIIGQHQKLLCQPRTKMFQYGDRSFFGVALALWNQLPDSLRTASSVGVFKRSLKTHLFLQAYHT